MSVYLLVWRKYSFCSVFTPKPKHCLIQFIDGRTYHGGLSDRIISIVSVYALSKAIGIDYKLSHTWPFRMENYLLPNKVNWIVSDKEISDNYWNSQFIFIKSRLRKKIKVSKTRQIHVYAHSIVLEKVNEKYDKNYSFHDLFWELFSSNAALQVKIKSLQQSLNTEYDAFVFRFQNLLGDFKEGNCEVYAPSAQEDLMLKCIEFIRHYCVGGKNEKILITSDSITFLQNAQKCLNNIVIVPGELTHMQYPTESGCYALYEKSFIDLLMLSKARLITSVVYKDMYSSGFPRTASKIGMTDFVEIRL